VWGFNARRTTKWRNETTFFNPNPAAYGGPGILQLSTAATLVGIETPARSLNLELKPYGITSLTTDRTAPVPFEHDGDADAGFDFKYGLTKSLTADMTVNTDFAQVEEDVQQVNLTRFSLFFPEKRDFFLEGQGNFGFAGQGTGGQFDGQSDVPTVFFSRRIGLSGGQVIPVWVGGRMTGRAGPFEIGLLNIQTGDKPEARAESTNFSVARIRRNILRRSNVGVITTLRSPAVGTGHNVAYGLDSNLRFKRFDEINLYYAATQSDGRGNDEASYRARFAYEPDEYGFSFEHLKVGADFNPEIGFVRRPDMRTSTAAARYSPRFNDHAYLRRLSWQGTFDYITNSAASQLENRIFDGSFTTEFNNSDTATVGYMQQYELLPANFPISPGVILPAGSYDWNTIRASYGLGNQRKVSGTVSASAGSFYDGTRLTGGYNGRVSFSPRFVLEPSLSLNRVELPYGDFNANLLSTRIVITPGPRMQVSSLLQWNASANTLTASARLRWEYTPGSELFVVYSDGRNTASALNPGLLTQTFAVKITRLFRF
jgi:hypothetical protein